MKATKRKAALKTLKEVLAALKAGQVKIASVGKVRSSSEFIKGTK